MFFVTEGGRKRGKNREKENQKRKWRGEAFADSAHLEVMFQNERRDGGREH